MLMLFVFEVSSCRWWDRIPIIDEDCVKHRDTLIHVINIDDDRNRMSYIVLLLINFKVDRCIKSIKKDVDVVEYKDDDNVFRNPKIVIEIACSFAVI